MKLFPQTSPDSVQAWTQEDFGYAVDSKVGLDSALETIFPACSPAPSTSSISTAAAAAAVGSSNFAELKPVPPLKALTQCHFIGSSVEVPSPEPCGGATGAFYTCPEPDSCSATQDIVSTTTAPELSTAGSVMLKPPVLDSICSGNGASSDGSGGSGGLSAMDHFLVGDVSGPDDDFASIIGNAMTDPQLVVPDNLELGSFTSSDMHELEAWIEGQSQARLQRLQSAAAAAVASSASMAQHSTSSHYASPMLQNLLAATPGSSLAPDCLSASFGAASGSCGTLASLRGGSSGVVGAAGTVAGYSPGMLSAGGVSLHHRLQKPMASTFSPPSYAALADSMSLAGHTMGGAKKRRPTSSSSASASAQARAALKMPIATEGTKDRPVHRCTICNRGFLNKSNIKVHLRTHTGEKPFKCETCNKAFRQKAHLLKHYHIHKRMTRD